MVRKSLLALMLALLTPALSLAQVKGLIVGPGAERYPIAVSALKNLGSKGNSGPIAEGIAETISHDLNLSGWFRVLDRSAYIENPQTSGITLGSFDFKDWSVIGAASLVKGGFSVQGDDLTVELRLFDVYQGKEIVGKKYSGKARDFRRIANKFADEIIFQFTGVPGVFNTRITYLSTAGGRFKQVYVSQLDGSEKVQITNDPTIHLFPTWSPDGQSILFTTYGYGGRGPGVYELNVFSGKETKILSSGGLNSGARWSPDRQRVAVTLERQGSVDIYVMALGGKPERLTQNSGINVSPAWSPDGKQLVFVSSRSGSPQLYIMDISTRKTRRLTYSGGYNTSPDWSPKGDKIVYTGRVGGHFNIYTIGVKGGEPQMLTSNSGDNEDASWSPDGRFIVFSSNRRGRYQIYMMQATGESQQRLTASGGDDTSPSWSPRLD